MITVIYTTHPYSWTFCSCVCCTSLRSVFLLNVFLASQITPVYLQTGVDVHVFVSAPNRIKREGESAGSWCWNEQD